MLSATIDNVPYYGFKSYNVSRSVEDVAGEFSLTLTCEGFDGLPFKKGSKIIIYANTTAILTGYIEALSVGYSDNDHTITITGRDKCADIIDSTIGSQIELNAPITLDKVIQTVLKQINASDVKVLTNFSGIKPFLQGELVSGEITETIFEFLEKYTRKRQVLMNTDGRGNIVLTRAGSTRAENSLVHVVEGDTSKNNILSGAATFDDRDRFHIYEIVSQGNVSAFNATNSRFSAEDIVNRKAIAIDSDIRPSRVLHLTAESASDIATLKERVNWECNIRRARSIGYSCTVQGHLMSENGKPWAPNLLVRVTDHYALIDADLLIKSVTYDYDTSGGSITHIECVPKDSYLPEPEPSKKEKQTNKVGRSKKKKRKRKPDISYPPPVRYEGDE